MSDAPEVNFSCCPAPELVLRQDDLDRTVWEIVCDACDADIAFLIDRRPTVSELLDHLEVSVQAAIDAKKRVRLLRTPIGDLS